MTDEQICELAKDKALDIQKYIIDGNVDIDSFAKDCCLAGAHSMLEEIKQWQESKRKLRLRLMQQIHELRNPWISVEEGLPEDNKTVLVWFGGYYTVAVMRDGEWWNCTGYQTGGGWSALDKIPDIASSFITHWMPIPELKEGE